MKTMKVSVAAKGLSQNSLQHSVQGSQHFMHSSQHSHAHWQGMVTARPSRAAIAAVCGG